MDTVHDLPARHDETGRLAQLAQTVAMLADAVARQRRAPDTERRQLVARSVAEDARGRESAARSAAVADAFAAAQRAATPDLVATPTVDEHALALVDQHAHPGQADAETATAERALAEARAAIAGTQRAVAEQALAEATAPGTTHVATRNRATTPGRAR